MRPTATLLCLALAAALPGCGTIRDQYQSFKEGYQSFKEGFAAWREAFWRDAFEDPARVDKIRKGEMTRQQVRDLLGEPNDQHTLNGEETWTYKSYRTVARAYNPLSNAKGGTMQSLEVRISFDRGGVVSKLDSEKQQW